MQLTGDRQLESWLRENNLPLVCLLYGEDGYQIERQRDRILKLATTDFPDFNLYQADGRVSVNFDELCDSALSLPFMAEYRTVVLDDLDTAAQDAVGFHKLLELLERPSETTCLVITLRTMPLELKKKSSRDSKLWELCDKTGLVCNLPKPTRSEVARLASTRAVKLGCKLDSAAAGLLCDYCAGELLRAFSETDKLAAYVGTGEITEDTVRLLVAPVMEARVFDIAVKLLRKDLEGALSIVSDLLFLRESPMSILSVLSMSFADLYRASAAKRAGVPTAQAQKELGYFGGSVYRYQKALENQSRFDSRALGQMVTLLAEADSAMKGSGSNASALLETTVTRLYGLCAGGARG
ncbi:MAG: DNA polymerase III subunit delta [Angelakisella sp.]